MPKAKAKPPLLPQQLAEVAADMSRQLGEGVKARSTLSPEQIHQLRTTVKRLRARWHLFRSGVGKMAAREADRNLRDAARDFATVRDAQVQLILLRDLAQNSGGKKKPNQAVLRLRDALAREFDATETSCPLDDGQRSRLIHRFHDDVSRWSQARTVAPGTLVDGMTRVFEKAQNFGHEAYKEDTPEAFHTWRKWVKYLYYQMEALAALQPGWKKEQMLLWKELGSLLGSRHDLSITLGILERREPPWKPRDQELSRKRALRLDEKLAKRCRTLYGKLFAESPKKFRLRVAARMLD